MKKILLLSVCSLCLLSCNVNPNKEARIQKLESEIEVANEKIQELEARIGSLENSATVTEKN